MEYNALSNASLETQAVCEDIVNDVKEYAKTVEGGFIPFDQFVKVIQGQYKQTPICELLVLKNRLIKYQQSSIFAKTAKEIDIIKKTVAKEKMIILDLSPLNVLWHKEFVNFILRTIKTPSFVFMRLNETNSDQNLITKIYQSGGAVNIIPSISHGYKKITSVSEHSKNYIMLPTLKPSRDFGYADCAVWNLDQNYALFFGNDTKELIFKIQNTITIDEEEVKNKQPRRIKLSNLQRYSTKLDNKFEKAKLKPKQDEIIMEEVKPTVLPSVLFEREEAQEPVSVTPSIQEEKSSPKEEVNYYQEIDFDEPKTTPTPNLGHEAFESADDEEDPIQRIEKPRVKEILNSEEDEDFMQFVNDIEEVELEETIDKIEKKEVYSKVYQNGITKLISEDELDYFDNETKPNYKEVDYSQKTQEDNPNKESWEEGEVYTQDEQNENLSLEDLANQSLEDTFVELVEEDNNSEKSQNFVVEGDDTINLGKIQEQIKNQENELPLFDKENNEKLQQNFNEGESVVHEKYGSGKILKVVTYSNRCLLQIEFDKIGKRLLDPTIAKLQKI
jgi:hypothetical protein